MSSIVLAEALAATTLEELMAESIEVIKLEKPFFIDMKPLQMRERERER